MTTMTTARDRLAELTGLKEATVHMLIETRYFASIHRAHTCAANARAEFTPLINDCGIKTDELAGAKPCK